MKKILKIFFFPILIPTITACQDKAHSIVSLKAVNSDYIEIQCTVDQITNLIESKQQFVLECYSPTCSHCEDLKPKLEKYAKDTGNIIYKLDLSVLENEEAFNEKLHNKYSDIFPNSYVPAIRYIKDGALTYEVNSNKFSSYTALSKIMNKHFITSKCYIVNSKADFNTYLSNHSRFFALAYDLDNPKSLEIAAKYLLTTENKKDTVLVNKSGFTGDFAEFLPFYGNTVETFLWVVDKENAQLKIIDYSLADDNQISEFISNF